MNTGGKAMLSTSFFSDSDSIHRKNSIAGEISTSTEKIRARPDAANARRRRASEPRLIAIAPLLPHVAAAPG